MSEYMHMYIYRYIYVYREEALEEEIEDVRKSNSSNTTQRMRPPNRYMQKETQIKGTRERRHLEERRHCSRRDSGK